MTTWTGELAWRCGFLFYTAVARWNGTIGSRSATVIVLLAAGVAAGGTGALVAENLVTSVTNAIRDSEQPAGVVIGGAAAALLIGPVCAIILAAQYKIGDTYASQVTYRFLSSAGSMPPNLARFLNWADDRVLLRKTGEGYVFVHRLYRDWWAAQPPSTQKTDSATTAAPTSQ
jgi:hypothetical protein